VHSDPRWLPFLKKMDSPAVDGRGACRLRKAAGNLERALRARRLPVRRGANAFLRKHAHFLRPGSSVLCVADGEGRNGVWLAEQGHRVTSFDFAPNAPGQGAATGAASAMSASISGSAIAYTWPWTPSEYDALVAVFIQFLPAAPARRRLSPNDVRGQARRSVPARRLPPEQVDYRTRRAANREHKYTREWLQTTFGGWEILVLEDYDAVIHEGQRTTDVGA
jgi:hypothetical protein